MTDSAGFPGGVPKGLTYEDGGHEITFSWRWFAGTDLFVVIFAVLWNTMLVGFVAAGAPLLMLSLHLFGGLFLAFYALRQVLNRTHVELRPGHLSVRSGPILAKDEVIATPFDLRQLYVREHRTGAVNGRPTYVYEVHALIGDRHSDVKVAGNVPTVEQAHFIEAQIERYLEIADKPVRGAIPRQRTEEEQFPVIPLDIEGTGQATRSELRDTVSERAVSDTAGGAAEWGGEIIDPN